MTDEDFEEKLLEITLSLAAVFQVDLSSDKGRLIIKAIGHAAQLGARYSYSIAVSRRSD